MATAENRFVQDVPSQFAAIPKKVCSNRWFGSRKKYLGARANDKIPDPDYTSKVSGSLGLGEHFQGIQRIGRHLIISGGIKTGTRRSQLIVIRMGTRLVRGPWALPKYGHNYRKPPADDGIVRVVDVDETRWYAGGIQCMGDFVAVPIYSGDHDSEIRYFEFSAGDSSLAAIPAITLNCSYTAAKAVALTRLPDNHYMTMIWDDHSLAFHYSKSEVFLDGFEAAHVNVNKDDVVGGFQPGDHGLGGLDGTYQSVNLVRQTGEGMYIVATRNSQKLSPSVTGVDYADLYRVAWPNGFTSPPLITLVKHRKFYCYNQQCNFGAGTGIYVDDEEHMYLYGVSHWLHGGGKRLNFNEYSYV